MSFFNNIEKVIYRKHTEDPVVLLEYIKFTDEKLKEKYLVFKFKNNLTQQLKDMKVLVNLFDENNCLIGTTTFVYKNFVVRGLEEFAPAAKLLVNYNTKYIEVKVIYALFDTLVWEEEKLTKLERVSFENEVSIDKKSQKVSKKVEETKMPRGSRKTKLKDISKGNRVVFPKILALILTLVLIGITAYGVYNVRTYSKSLSDSNFEYEITSSTEVSITKYVGSSSKVVIPETYKKYKVVAIESDAFDGLNIKTVTFEGGKITIGSNAFADCESLVEVVDENGAVRTVYKNAFKNCPKLNKVQLPKAKLLNDAFSNCSSLETLAIYSIEGEELVDCGVSKTLIDFSIEIGELESYFFEGYINIKTLRLTGDVFVSSGCFVQLSRLKTLYIGEEAIVSPSALAGYIRLEVYLHKNNESYSSSDYELYNPRIEIHLYE